MCYLNDLKFVGNLYLTSFINPFKKMYRNKIILLKYTRYYVLIKFKYGLKSFDKKVLT